MYICIYIYIYIFVYDIYIYMYKYINMYTYIYIYIYIYIQMFDPEVMKSKSMAAANLCNWVVNIVKFNRIYVKVCVFIILYLYLTYIKFLWYIHMYVLRYVPINPYPFMHLILDSLPKGETVDGST
jgi:hypothetical protein